MSDNPLEMNSGREQRIRERAYQLWQDEGRPEGSDLEYWERASELVGMEESAGSSQRPLPTEANSHLIAGQIVEEATIQQNLGEFPDRLSDQGEHPQTPNRANRKTS